MAQMKAKEKQMKEEKEEERQVRHHHLEGLQEQQRLTVRHTAPCTSYQGQASEKGRKGEIRQIGREDAP